MNDAVAKDTIRTGEVNGSLTAKQLPNVPGSVVNIKAQTGNSGNVYIGGSSDITTPGGSDDQTTGFELDAGQETGWIPVSNLNNLWIICDNAGDDITYMTLS